MATFKVIVSDPPWSFEDALKQMKKRTRRSAQSQYATLSLVELCQLDVKKLADPEGCVLFLWVPSALIAHGLGVMEAWGFKQKGTFVWGKTKAPTGSDDINDVFSFGMGRLFRQAHELALIGTSGKSVYRSMQNHSQRSIALAPNMGHSIKPEEPQDRLDLMFPDSNRLEMFARRVRPGWTCIGDAIDGKDVRHAVQELILL